MTDFSWFSDEQWARVEPLLPLDTRGMPRVDDRRALSGIVHALKSGGRGGDCPGHVYGPKKTLYNCFRRCVERGVWEPVMLTVPIGTNLARRSQMRGKNTSARPVSDA